IVQAGVGAGRRGDGCIIERLGVNVAIQADRELLAELAQVDVGWGQDSFGEVLSGAGDVVVIGQNVDVRREEEPVLQILEAEWEFAWASSILVAATSIQVTMLSHSVVLRTCHDHHDLVGRIVGVTSSHGKVRWTTSEVMTARLPARSKYRSPMLAKRPSAR